MPVEDVWKYKGVTRGAIPSRKLGRAVRWKSPLARDYSRLLEYDPQVLSYEELPCKISFKWKGATYQCVPDFLVQRQDQNPTIVVCARTRHLQDPAYRARWTAMQRWCQARHYTFSLVTEEALQKHAVLIQNLQRLTVHAHRTIEPPVIEYLLRTIAASPQPLSLPEIIQLTPQVPARLIPGAIWHLLAVGLLKTNLTQPLHVMNTPIWMKGTKNAIAPSEEKASQEGFL